MLHYNHRISRIVLPRLKPSAVAAEVDRSHIASFLLGSHSIRRPAVTTHSMVHRLLTPVEAALSRITTKSEPGAEKTKPPRKTAFTFEHVIPGDKDKGNYDITTPPLEVLCNYMSTCHQGSRWVACRTRRHRPPRKCSPIRIREQRKKRPLVHGRHVKLFDASSPILSCRSLNR